MELRVFEGRVQKEREMVVTLNGKERIGYLRNLEVGWTEGADGRLAHGKGSLGKTGESLESRLWGMGRGAVPVRAISQHPPCCNHGHSPPPSLPWLILACLADPILTPSCVSQESSQSVLFKKQV